MLMQARGDLHKATIEEKGRGKANHVADRMREPLRHIAQTLIDNQSKSHHIATVEKMLENAQRPERQVALMKALGCEEEFYCEHRRHEADTAKHAKDTECSSKAEGSNTENGLVPPVALKPWKKRARRKNSSV